MDENIVSETVTQEQHVMRVAFDTAVDGMILIDAKGIVQHFNPASVKLFGYEAAEVIGQNVKMLMPQHYAHEHDQYLTNYQTTGEAKIIGIGREVKGRRKDGSEFPMELSVGHMETDGQSSYVGVIRDVSERKEIEKIRKKADEVQKDISRYLTSVINTAVDGMILINAKGIVQHFNPASVKLFGYEVEEVIGQNVKMLMPQHYAHEHDQYLTNYQTTGEAKIIGIGREVVGLRKDGSEFPMELSVGHMETDGQSNYVGVIRDISERKAAALRHEGQAKYLAEVIDTAVDGMILIDAKGIVQHFNPASVKLFGYEVEEVVGQNVKMLMPQHYAHEHDQYLTNYQTTGDAKIIGIGREVTGLRKDGSEFPMELSVGHMETDGQSSYVGVIRDVSERKAAEQQREILIGDLSKSNQELDDFAYIASHDLKEPLRGLANNALFLAEDYSETIDEDGNKRLSRIQYLAKRMEKLIDNLLYFSRLGRQDLAIQKVNLNDIVHDILNMIEGLLEQENVTVRIPSPLPTIICDQYRVAEAFRNLITNAIKYNKNDQKIIDVAFHKELQGRKNVFSIADNGIGIAPKFYDDIFKIFKRLNNENDAVKGTGVGLTFVKKIIERHGGEIWLNSALGAGTTFYFTLAKGDN